MGRSPISIGIHQSTQSAFINRLNRHSSIDLIGTHQSIQSALVNPNVQLPIQIVPNRQSAVANRQ
jgi:hypothetical protein